MLHAPAVLLSAMLAAAVATPGRLDGATAQEPIVAGMRLAEALTELQARGLKLVFNSAVVREEMRVEVPPSATEPDAMLDELLEPHDLRAVEAAAGTLVVVPAPRPRDAKASGEAGTDAEMPHQFDEIVVRSTAAARESGSGAFGASLRPGGWQGSPAPAGSQDPLRGLARAPGATAAEASAEVGIRGGRSDENLVLLDGVELVEPYHLRDFGRALSIVAPAAIDRIEVAPSGLSAEYGDLSSGVINLVTAPAGGRRTVLATGLLETQALRSQSFAAGRGSWLAVGRLGTFDQALRVGGRREKPDYFDLFGKAEWSISDGLSARAHLLYSDDHLRYAEAGEPAVKDYRTRYLNTNGWLSLARASRRRWSSSAVLSYNRVSSHRVAEESSDARRFTLDASSDFLQLAARGSWRFELSSRHALDWGGELRSFDAHPRHQSDIEWLGWLTPIRETTLPSSSSFDRRFREEQWAVWASDAYRAPSGLSVEAGLRVERYSLSGNTDLSPRLAVAWAATPRSVLRFSAGRYVHNQRLYELQVLDGETDFGTVESSEQVSFGFEHRPTASLLLRAASYYRVVGNPRLRFENLFEPTSAFPELQADRVGIDPEHTEALGLELTARYRFDGGSLVGSWVLSEATDRLGGVEVRRSIDQPHALGLGFERRIGPWRLDVVGYYRSGWPTTPVGATPQLGADSSRLVPRLGPLFSERLPAYHRLDLRVTRRWPLRLGHLEAWVDLENVYAHHNVRGYEFFEGVDVGGEPLVERRPLEWRGLFPSFGLRWEL